MKWRKPSAEVIDLFLSLAPDRPDVDLKPMFGCPCLWTGGNMFAAVHQESIVVRLDEARRAELLALPGAAPFEPMPGRPMREYVVVPAALHDRPDVLRAWFARACAYAATLPPKVKKRRTGK